MTKRVGDILLTLEKNDGRSNDAAVFLPNFNV